jgi:pimeloyl-ACP methyl ester carboxylesterase
MANKQLAGGCSTGTVYNAGASLHYLTFGKKDRPCLMFIHGAGGNAVSWFQNTPHFQSKVGGLQA